MATGDSACPQPAQTVDAHERARAYEIAAYLSAASFPFDIADGPPANPIPNTDVALNALVQHGAHKMECDRAFLSFIDNRFQFICAEMTRHQSILGPDPTQPLLLGTTRIALEWGVCPYTMSVFHGKEVTLPASPYIVADESYFCIKDFRQVPSFAARPYVAGYPHMVSYIEIPLRSLSGHILGSYCVVDNKSRDFLHPDALRTIREVTLAISQYLDLKRVEGGRIRSERVMDGLRQFIGSGRHIQSGSVNTTNPFSLNVFEQASRTSSDSHSKENVECDHFSDVSRSSRSTLSEPSGNSCQCPIDSNVASEVLSMGTPGSTTISPLQTNIAKQATSSLSTQVGDLFSKAAHIIGHAMNLDGLVFFDAVGTGTRYIKSRSSSCITNDEPSQPITHEDKLSAKPLSEYQEDFTAEQQMVHRPSQSLIRRLTAAYPHGHIFTVDEYGIFEQSAQGVAVSQSSSGTSAAYNDWKGLSDCIPKARYAIFLPHWHYQRELCFSTCLAWVSDTGKTLDINDVNSLTAFGNSLMAEVFRLEAATNTQQKSDFISSISHELRSPLHGILATVELMQENIKDSHLLSMTQMIESCSYTLLDTFDHLLEFSKINSRKGERQSAQLTQLRHNAGKAPTKELVIDLGSLIEDVLETVSLSQTSVSQMESGLKRERQDSFAGGGEVTPLIPALATTYIEHSRSWALHVESGAWKRILLNVFSNALRYTESGYIDVTLKMLEKTDAGRRYINLSVTDTGIGMSPEFLKYHLFTPFMQENSLISGTGLGLSIVKSIVDSLDGKIFVESRQHEGTCVTINIPFDEELTTSGQPDFADNLRANNKMENLTIGLISVASQDAPNSKPTLRIVSPPKLLQRCLRNICEGHFGMRVVDNTPVDTLLKTEIILLDTHALSSIDMLNLHKLFPEVVSTIAARAVVVLGPTRKGGGKSLGVEGATFISSPLTRKKLWDAFTQALNKVKPAEAKLSQSSDVDSQEASHRSKSTFRGDLPMEDELTIIQSKPANPPLRNALSQVSLDAEADSPPTHRPPRTSPSQQLHTAAAGASNPDSMCRFKRLLLVDDNLINLKVLGAFAKKTGRPFSTAFNGAEAVRLYKKAVLEDANPFDCVFMDISMPVMDGFQATAAIREFEEQQRKEHQDPDANVEEKKSFGDDDNEQQKAPPLSALRSNIMALTGLGSEEARSTAIDSGFDMFLLKPLKFKDLVPLLGPLPINSEL